MNHLDYLIKEIDILPANDFIYLWDNMQEKMKRIFIMQFPQVEKRPYELWKGEFTVTNAFFEPLPDELIDLFDGKETN